MEKMVFDFSMARTSSIIVNLEFEFYFLRLLLCCPLCLALVLPSLVLLQRPLESIEVIPSASVGFGANPLHTKQSLSHLSSTSCKIYFFHKAFKHGGSRVTFVVLCDRFLDSKLYVGRLKDKQDSLIRLAPRLLCKNMQENTLFINTEDM